MSQMADVFALLLAESFSLRDSSSMGLVNLCVVFGGFKNVASILRT